MIDNVDPWIIPPDLLAAFIAKKRKRKSNYTDEQLGDKGHLQWFEFTAWARRECYGNNFMGRITEEESYVFAREHFLKGLAGFRRAVQFHNDVWVARLTGQRDGHQQFIDEEIPKLIREKGELWMRLYCGASAINLLFNYIRKR